jgi:hypothetical protein
MNDGMIGRRRNINEACPTLLIGVRTATTTGLYNIDMED